MRREIAKGAPPAAGRGLARLPNPRVKPITVGAAFLPVGKLADISNAGTLFAFAAVAIAVLSLRRTDPQRVRPFRTPAVWVVAPLTIIGCVVLYCRLPYNARMVLPVWGGIGLLLYLCYGYRNSHVGRGVRCHFPLDE